VIDDGVQYGRDWLNWWAAIQPPSRHMGKPDELLKQPCNELAEVVVCGPNGLLSAVKSLSWWRKSISATRDVSSWNDAVLDVIWVLKNASS